MTEKRFTLYEHKDNDYILDNPNVHLDFIEMLGDALTSEEIVDLLNTQHETIERLKQNIDELLSVDIEEELVKENEQLKQRINSRLHFYRELYETTNDEVVKRVIEDLEDILR